MAIKKTSFETKKHSKRKKLWMLTLGFIMCTAVSVGTMFTACDEETSSESPAPVFENDGNYYYAAVDGEYTLLLAGGKVALTIGADTKMGAYNFDGTDLQLVFDDNTLGMATVENGTVTLVYQETTYKFIQKANYTVSYSVDGTVTGTAKVLNGKTVEKPADPVKAGYVFIGWYADAEFTTPFAFGATPVTANTTLYAYFMEKTVGQDEFTATLIVDGTVLKTQPTRNGVLYELPTPTKADATFAGWWTSDSQDATKLTAKYTDQVLKENTNLYAVWTSNAPLVSVTSTGVKWEALGAGVNYTVSIYSNDVEIKTQKTTATEYAFDFASRAAGEFKVEVSVDDVKTTAYYTNKALDRVSNFVVNDLSVLVFNPVENAEKYLITVDCGNDFHLHQEFDNGNSTNFNFANCAMQEGGITFTVKAVARGYVSSVSETYTFTRDLADVTGLTLNTETAALVWNTVEKATSYLVEVTANEKTDKYTVNENKFSLSNYTGAVSVKVTAMATGYNSSVATASYTLTKLPTPSGIVVLGDQIKWTAVADADKYIVMINGEKAGETETNAFAIPDNYKATGMEYTVSVQAVSETANSFYSAPVTVKYGQVNEVFYLNGLLNWTPVGGAATYEYTVNGLGLRTLEEGETSAKVTFTQEGDNVILFKAKDAYGNSLGEKRVVVKAYELTLYGRKKGVGDQTKFVAVGDTIDFPQLSLDGYKFAGWYNVPGGADANGSKFDGSVYKDTTVYALYAYWMPEEYEVILMVGEQEFARVNVKYEQNYTLPTPEMVGGSAFNGWNGEADGSGTPFTDADGKSKGVWLDAEGRTLYATWAEALTATKLENRDAYSISMAPGLKNLTEVTIPATWKVGDVEYPVVEIAGEAFYNCKNLETINLPDTIENIFIGEGGVNAAGSSFFGCNNLKNINVYETEGTHPVYFKSVDGVLLRVAQPNMEMENGTELYYFPAGRTGAYEIPEGVEFIPQRVFQNAKITDVVVPTSVSMIGKQAFEKSSVSSVVFTATEDGEYANDLVLDASVFAYCYSLTTVDFPARLTETDFGGLTIFDNCTALREINVVGNDGVYSSRDGMICDSTGRQLIYCPVGRTGEVRTPVTITGIADRAFMGCKKITKVSIRANVAEIGEEAFMNCTGITTINFEGSSESGNLEIAEKAFYGCTSLRGLVLPANLIKIAAKAFGNTVMNNSVILNGGANIEYSNDVFVNDDGVGKIQHITIGANMGSFQIKGVFNGCPIESVTVENGNQNYFADENGVLYNAAKTELLYYPKKDIQNYTIPETVTTIASGVFEGITYFETITIGKNVTTIGSNAFKNMSRLTTVNFEPGRTAPLTIGDNAFENCAVLTTIALPETLTSLGAYAFKDCVQLTSLTLPSTLVKLGNETETGVFDGCTRLASIGVAAAGNDYFESRNGIIYGKTEGNPTTLEFVPASYTGAIEIPSTVHTIPENAFYGMQGITTITWENNQATSELRIGDAAFAHTLLTEVRLPSGLTVIPTSAFEESSVTKIYVPNTVNLIQLKAFHKATGLVDLTFEDGNNSNTLVLEDGGWKSFNKAAAEGILTDAPLTTSGLKLPNRVKMIPDFYFEKSVFTKVHIPESVARIGIAAFANCTALTELKFAEASATRASLTLGWSAFSGCTALESLKVPSSITKYEGTHGTAVTVGTGGVYIHGAFRGLTKLNNLSFEDGLTTLGSGMFYGSGATTIANVVLPSSLTTIGESAFATAKLNNGITLNGNLTTIGNNAFYNVTTLTSIALSEKVETIGAYAFSGCSGLTSVDFSANKKLSAIGNYAFASCKLTSVNLPDNTANGVEALTFGVNIFNNVTTLTSANIPDTVTSLNNAFVGCTNVQITYSKLNGTDNGQGFVLAPLANNKFRLVGYTGTQTEVTIPDNVEMIGESAFAGTSVTKVTIPASVKVVESYAFNNVATLTTVVGGEGLTNVEAYAFAQSGITAISLPALTSLGNNAFYRCTALETVTLNNNEAFKVINASTFEGCTKLNGIVLPAYLETLGVKAFSGCTSLTSITLPEKLTNSDATTAAGQWFSGCTALASVTINSTNLNVLPYYAFKDCSALESIVLPKGITTIAGSFVNTKGKGLKTIVFPETLTTIMEVAFGSPFSGTQIETLDFSNTQLTTIIGAYAGSEMTFASLTTLKTIIFPETITTLPKQCLDSTSNLETFIAPGIVSMNFGLGSKTKLTKVELSPELVSIGDRAFSGCSSLANFDFPETLKSIGASAFYGTGLTSLELGPNVETVGAFAFENSALTEVTIPASLDAIGDGAFASCSNLTRFNVSSSNTRYLVGNYGELRDATGKIVCVLTSTEGTGGTFTVGENDTIGSYAFAGCENIREIILPDNMTAIPYGAFANSYIETMTVPENVTEIGEEAFAACQRLKTITLPSGIKKIGGYAFYYCTALQSFALPASVTEIGEYAFNYAKGLTDVTISTNVTSIGTYAFAYSSIQTLTIADNRVSDLTVGQSAFAYCKSLTTVTMGNRVPTIAYGMFDNCSALSSVKLSSSATSIAKYAFRKCSALTYLEIPYSVTSIVKDAFNGWASKQTICLIGRTSAPTGFKSGWKASATVTYKTN